MSDFSLTTLFVVPVGQTTLPSSGSTQDLTAGQVGIFRNDYTLATAGNIAAAPYFYVAQGRANTFLQGSKRSDKIKGGSNVIEWYKVSGCATPNVQVTEISNFSAKCGEDITVTLRGHSSYLDTLYFNGFTRSVTVSTPCCDCGADLCEDVDVPALIDSIINKFKQKSPGLNSDNITFNDFYTFERVGNDQTATLRISGKPLTKYGQPCDVAANPFEYDRMYFRTFVYSGPATTVDFIVADNCNIVANSTVLQRSSYATGTASEIAQLEKNFYSYQAGYLKHLYRMAGYNGNFESYAADGVTYDTYYIKFNEINKGEYNYGDYITQDSTVIIAAPNADTSSIGSAIETVLEAALGTVIDNNTCITSTTTSSTSSTSTTSTTSTLIP